MSAWTYVKVVSSLTSLHYLLLSKVVVTITHFICANHHIISFHYTSSQTEISFCHLAFVLLDDLIGLHRILALNKGFYFKICQFFMLKVT